METKVVTTADGTQRAWMSDRGACSTALTAASWLWFSSGMPGTDRTEAMGTLSTMGGTGSPAGMRATQPIR